jgi:hypothetical protein
MVLGGDAGERVGAITVALEIKAGDPPENAGEAALHVGFLLAV